MFRAKLLPAACLLWLTMGVARAQAPISVPTVIGPAGAYTVVVPGMARFEYGTGYLVVRWGDVPPGPVPFPPQPPEPPAPPAPPVPAKHTGPFFVSLILPTNPTQEQNDLRVSLLALDPKALKIEGRRSYLDGQSELSTLKLADAVAKHIPPILVIQEKPTGAKEGAAWPIISTVEPRAAVEIQAALEELAK